MSWIKACAVDALPEGEARVLPVDPPVSIFNTGDGYFAIDDTCTHETASLADGWIEGETVECPLHQARFCLRSGAALTSPAWEPVRTYPVKVEDGAIFVDMTPAASPRRPTGAPTCRTLASRGRPESAAES